MATTQVVLRKVLKGRQISREEVKDLWKNGKITGLFNIPYENEEIFNQCQDFCIELDVDYDLELRNRDSMIQDLQKKISNLQEGNKQFIQTIVSLKQQVADFQATQLTKEEDKSQHESKLKVQIEKKQERVTQLSVQVQQLEQQNRELVDKMEKTNDFKLKLQVEVNNLRAELQQANSQIRDFKSQYKERNFDSEKVLQQLQQRNLQLESDVLESNKNIKDLFAQNKDLYQRLQKMTNERDKLLAENKEYKNHQHEFTYTDHMNKYLLSSLYQSNASNTKPLSLQNLPMLNKVSTKDEDEEEPSEFD